MNADRYRKLFFDDRLIERKEGISRVVNQPQKYEGNPVIKADRPWESGPGSYSSVIFDQEEKIFKIWYYNWNPTGHAVQGSEKIELPAELWATILYATSEDGVNWVKPQLGIIDFLGSKDNNIVLTSYGKNPEEGCLWGLSVVKDLKDPNPQKRYKMMFTDVVPLPSGKGSWGWCVAFSSDGIHWNKYPKNPVWTWNEYTTDEISMFYDQNRGRFVVLFQCPWEGAVEWGGERAKLSPVQCTVQRRNIGRSESDDLVHWAHPQVILVPQPPDPFDAHLYSMKGFNYEDIYVGLLEVYRDHQFSSEGHRGLSEIELVSSRDGTNWTRVGNADVVLFDGPDEVGWILKEDRQVFIPRSSPEQWDCCLVMGNCALLKDDEVWVYYGGWSKAHNAAEQALPGTTGIGLARLKRDRFVSMAPIDEEGTLVTRPVIWEAESLHVNTKASGRLAVEVFELDDSVVSGMSAKECEGVTGDTLDQPIMWNAKSRFPALVGKSVRLKFQLRNASLFSFWFG